MANFKGMAIFAEVVESGSFTLAAKRLGITRSAVSQQVSLLEEELGTRLLQRTTRQLSLTEAGNLYLHGCRQMVDAAEAANREISQYSKEPSGSLRISCSQDFATKHLAPLLASFLEKNTKLTVDIDVTDEVIDLVADQIDIAIRIGHLPDSGLVARKICDLSELLVAAPNYLQRHGEIKTPADLTKHQWVALTQMPQPYQINILNSEGQRQRVRLYGKACSNSASMVQQMVVCGMGIGRLLDIMVQKDLRENRLVQILPDYRLEPVGLYAVFPQKNHIAPKVRAIIEYLIENRHEIKVISNRFLSMG